MTRIMAIDYGRKRIGLAVSDEAHMLVTPLPQVQFNQKNVWSELSSLVRENNPQKIVVGDPDSQSNQPIRKEILDFKQKLASSFPNIIFTFFDESYSSEEAKKILSEIYGHSHKKAKKNKKKLDSVAAALILRRYLENL